MSIEPTNPPRSQQPAVASTLPSSSHGRTPSANQFSSLPASNVSGRPTTAGTTNSVIDELGYGVGYGKADTHRQNWESKALLEDPVTSRPTASSPTSNTTTPGRRPNSARSTNPTNRFTITNAEPEIPEETTIRKTSFGATSARNVTSPQQPQQRWPTAIDEKRAYELARSKVEKVQGVAAAVSVSCISILDRR